MLATAITLAVLWFVGTMLGELVRQNGDKIIAALRGRSWASERSLPTRPVTIRFSSRYMAAAAASVPAPLRAAA